MVSLCLLLRMSLLFLSLIGSAHAARCLYVSSYHAEYEWDAGIRRGLEPLLTDQCELRRFFMDTKRNQDEAFARLKAREAFALIESYQPDVVIAADDNASGYLVAPYLKNGPVPVVFCGVNNSAEPYGYPYRNATGMVEVTPVQAILKAIKELLPQVKRGIFLSADVLSQRRMFERMQQGFSVEKIKLYPRFVLSQDDWERAWKTERRADFVFVGNPAGIEGWDTLRARAFVRDHADKLTVSAWDWLAPLAMLTITKVPEEQGEWAGQVTREVLRGVSPAAIPVVINRRWHMYVNKGLCDRAGIELPAGLLHNAVEVGL